MKTFEKIDREKGTYYTHTKQHKSFIVWCVRGFIINLRIRPRTNSYHYAGVNFVKFGIYLKAFECWSKNM